MDFLKILINFGEQFLLVIGSIMLGLFFGIGGDGKAYAGIALLVASVCLKSVSEYFYSKAS